MSGQQHRVPSPTQDGPTSSAAALTTTELIGQDLLGNAAMLGMLFGTQTSGGEPLTDTATASDFSTRAQQLFPQLDADSDGYISAAEVDAAVVDDQYTGADAAVVATLNKLSDELEELSDDEWFDENSGVTLADLQAYERTGDVAGGLRRRVEGQYAYSDSRIAAGSGLLYGPTGAPTVEAVNQGQLGDCFFLAAVASVVSRNPTDITDIIADNLDGTYTVTFPGQSAISVSGPTDAELGQYANGKGHGFWITVIEKAYGIHRGGQQAIPSEGADDGMGTVATGIAVLTGHSTNLDTLGLTSREVTVARLDEAFDNDRIVTVGTRNTLPWEEDEAPHGLVPAHQYSVLDWDSATSTLTLRNPWGHGERSDNADGTDDGTFTMTLDEALETFATIGYEQGT
jgi:hypothetical protein